MSNIINSSANLNRAEATVERQGQHIVKLVEENAQLKAALLQARELFVEALPYIDRSAYHSTEDTYGKIEAFLEEQS